jgi:hypothetical protein
MKELKQPELLYVERRRHRRDDPAATKNGLKKFNRDKTTSPRRAS